MDVEKTRKMNELIGELKKHRILGNDVVSRAEEIVLKEEVPKEESETEKLGKRFEYILSENNKIIKEELEFLKDNILKLSEEVNSLREEVSKSTPEKQETIKTEETPKEEEQKGVKPEIKPGNHPKQGGYSPEDVAVDKVFYFGKK